MRARSERKRFTHSESASGLELDCTATRIGLIRDALLAVLTMMCSGRFITLAVPAVSGLPQPVDFKTLFIRHVRFLR